MSIHPYYCNLARAKRELKASTTTDDTVLLEHIQDVSQRIDTLMNPARSRPYFMPYQETRKLRLASHRINSNDNTFALRHSEQLLAFTAVSVGTTTVTSSVEGFPTDITPYRALRDTRDSATWYDEYFEQASRAPVFVSVTGTWGYHRDYDSAWETATTLNGTINASVTSVTVTDGTTLSPGDLIRIDSEFMTVTAVSTNTLTVKRGANGTTAAAHDTDSVNVDVFQVEFPIQRVVARQAALLYARQGAFQVETLDGVGVITYPQDFLMELRRTLTGYMYA